jgi:hypothetical protein
MTKQEALRLAIKACEHRAGTTGLRSVQRMYSEAAATLRAFLRDGGSK